MFAVSIAAPLNGAPREVDVFKEAARLAYDVAKHEVDQLNVGVDPRTAGRLEGVEQTIGMLDGVVQWFGWRIAGFLWSMGQDSTVSLFARKKVARSPQWRSCQSPPAGVLGTSDRGVVPAST
jgi:hypothetical protein